mgnify:CR=1 FL=1
MEKRDLIIGGFSNYDWDKIKYWANSIDISGFTGHKIAVALSTDKKTIETLIDKNFTVVQVTQNKNIPIHVERFIHIWNVLSNLQKDFVPRYVVTTDVKDVVFQRNPIEWLEENLDGKHLVAGSESMKYKDEPWGNQNLYEAFGEWFHNRYKENPIYNVGTIAGSFPVVRDLCLMIFQMSINRPIPIVDQAVYNFLLWQEPYRSITKFATSEDGWAAQLGTTADPSKIDQFKPFLLEETPKMIDEKVVTSTGKEFALVHQYDRVPEWKNIIERKYG